MASRSQAGADTLRRRARDYELEQRNGGGGESDLPDLKRPRYPIDPTWAPPVAMRHPLKPGANWYVHPSNLERAMKNHVRSKGKLLTNKFPARCLLCKHTVPRGQRVKWIPDEGIVHVPRCPGEPQMG